MTSMNSWKSKKLPISLTVIMPVFNEAERVAQAIEDILYSNLDLDIELIIVESASTDGTRQIVQSYASKSNIILIFQSEPKGKGSAVIEALKIARNQVICIFDADLEYHFNDVVDLLQPINDGQTNFVLGSRWAGNSIRDFKTQNWKGNLLNYAHVIGATLINISFGIKTKDPFTMWKVFTRESIQDINFRCQRFDWDIEVIGELALKGIKPIEIPASYKSRDYSQGKKIKFSREVPILLKVITVIFMKRIKQITFGRAAT
jgi:glycosyltransferase involved in cell wall biosynthesis